MQSEMSELSKAAVYTEHNTMPSVHVTKATTAVMSTSPDDGNLYLNESKQK